MGVLSRAECHSLCNRVVTRTDLMSVLVPPCALRYLAVGMELSITLVLVRMSVLRLCRNVAWTVTVTLTPLEKLKQLMALLQTLWLVGLNLLTTLIVCGPGVLDSALVGNVDPNILNVASEGLIPLAIAE